MGMAYMGLTHCEKCYKPLKDDEYVFCKKCEEENRKKDKSMKKKYKGYELIKAISDGEIKDGTKIIPHYPNNDCTVKYFEYYYGFLDAYYEDGRGSSKDVNVCIFLDNNRTFEVIEDEIDIDSIKEMELDVIDDVTYYINDLIKAVKQLNKEVKELKEDK